MAYRRRRLIRCGHLAAAVALSDGRPTGLPIQLSLFPSLVLFSWIMPPDQTPSDAIPSAGTTTTSSRSDDDGDDDVDIPAPLAGSTAGRIPRQKGSSASSGDTSTSAGASASAKRRLARKPPRDEEESHQQRACANRRERQRTKELNDAFALLRKLIPSMPSDKMSKIHTLRIATDYIRFLDQMKRDDCKLFGVSIFDEKNGYGLQASFNIWRGGNSPQLTMASMSPQMTPMPAMPCIPPPMPYMHPYMGPYLMKPEYTGDVSDVASSLSTLSW